MKNFIVVTGGAGFVGSHLIEFLIKKTKYKIISIDNYSSGSKKNHVKSSRVKYIKGNTLNIVKLLKIIEERSTHYSTLENLQEFFKVLKI